MATEGCPQPAFKGLKIMARQVLVVDDSPTVRTMVKTTLQNEGYDVITAQDGEKALKTADDTKVDLIITDINMPNMDGIELIKMLRSGESNKHTPILVITTEGGSNVKEAGKAAGATGWIVKPFQPEVLIAACKKVAG